MSLIAPVLAIAASSATSTSDSFKVKNDDDWIDRLSHRYTVVMLCIFALTVSVGHWVGDAITCWAPVHFTGNHIKYANSYCWVRNTYYLPFDREIPRPDDRDAEHTVIYYQWIPFILIAQAVLFYAPTVVWHAFNDRSGVDSDDILAEASLLTRLEAKEMKDDPEPEEDKPVTPTTDTEAASGSEASPDENENKDGQKKEDDEVKLTRRETIAGLIHRQIDLYLTKGAGKVWRNGEVHFRKQKKENPGLCYRIVNCHPPWSKRMGNYLVLLYILSKVAFVVNVIGQMFLLNSWLGINFNMFGIDIIKYLIKQVDWTETNALVAFPRVTMCDFNIRRLGNVHRYTLQCVLPINMYIEKMYIILWFWFCLVAILSILSLLTWTARFVSMSDKITFVRNHLEHKGRLGGGRDRYLIKFVHDYLGQDGTFIMRLIAHNTDSITVTEIMCKLWDKWMELIPESRNRFNALNPNPLAANIELENLLPKADVVHSFN